MSRSYSVQAYAEGGWNAFITTNHQGLPVFTFQRPEGMTIGEARQLKEQADRLCGGTLRVKALA